jgi:2-polyprenyl-6-methoxyphenol hydroxylase-like FAD-dependent oxidoreductase
MTRRILISGASIAGNAAAWWLGELGLDVTVVEQAPAFRDGGQNIDIRGVGREVLRRMGLEDAALAAGTGETGTAWIEADGREVARFDTDELGTDGPTAEMEILRGDLARLLYDAARDRATWRFGDRITDIADSGDTAMVSFDSGATARYDAVIVAEGVGSATRERVFPGENDPRWMDMLIAYFTIPRLPDDDRLWRWYNAPGKRSLSLRPDSHGTTRAMLCLSKAPEGEERWPAERQQAFLRDRFRDAGWQADRILGGMAASDDFYFDSLRQVRMPRWSSGRVVLTGDAAWCVTPLGGIGATLAVTGGYVLAQEIARQADPAAAFAAYEAQMRPMVAEGQGTPKIAPRLMHPDSRFGIRLLHGVLGVAASAPVRKAAAKLFGGPSKEPDFGRYDVPMAAADR